MRRLLLVLVAFGVLAGPALAAGEPPAVAVAVSASAAASPNGDGVKDTVAVAVTLPSAAVLTVTVERAGAVVAKLADSLAAEAGTLQLAWDGRDAQGARVADGPYEVAARMVTAEGAESTARADVRIDTKPPAVRWLSLGAQPGAGPLRGRYLLADAAPSLTVALVLRNRAGQQWSSARRSRAPGQHAEPWPLRGPGGGKLASGVYRAAIRATDDAENASVSAARPVLVQRPVAARTIRRVDGAAGLVALTFDDCTDGAAWTSILGTLRSRRAGGTFFCLAPEVRRHAAQARRTLREGHAIGNHGSEHFFLPSHSFAEVQREADRGTQVWWQLARTAPLPYYRPAYGALSPTALAAIGSRGYSRVMLWDVDPQDWRRPGSAAIVERVTTAARAGSVILLHVLPQTAAALPAIVSGLRSRGLHPVTLDRLFAAGR
jgi:peptidoglycan/xylan/chitin deacetylase (PgdA/CDA1 family)